MGKNINMKNKISQNLTVLSLRFIAVDIFFDILLWPVWWYTKGALRAFLFCLKIIRGQAERMGYGIWLKNLFTPMYGQRDLQGRLISFLVRFVMIVFKSIFLLFWSLFIFLGFFLWELLPLIAILGIISNIHIFFYE